VVLQVEAGHGRTLHMVVSMTSFPPPDLPGYSNPEAEEVTCPKHDLVAIRRRGKLICPVNGHLITIKKPAEGSGSGEYGQRQ
jgi:hypothetical protein